MKATGSTILVVDDNDEFRETTVKALGGLGHEVVAARSARQAQGKARALGARLDLLVTDLVLDGVDGLALADRLISLKPTLRVLFMSGYAGSAMRLAGLRGARRDFLEKPFTPAQIEKSVARLLAKGRDTPG